MSQYPAAVGDTPRLAVHIADKPTTIDLLDFKRFAIPIASRCASLTAEADALTLGLYGEWGSGKSSLLMMVREELDTHKIYPIWFNAWKYDREENLWAALLQTILDQAKLAGPLHYRLWARLRIWRHSFNWRAGTWESLKRLFPLVLRASLVFGSAIVVFGYSKTELESLLGRLAQRLLGTQSLITLGFTQVHIIKAVTALCGLLAVNPDGWYKLIGTHLRIDFSKWYRRLSYRDRIAFLDDFSTQFREIVRLVGRGKPLVVIIDDLDRCLPEKAVQVLEAIKLFLDVPGCVFLLAVDRDLIETAIKIKYKDVLASTGEPLGDTKRFTSFLAEDYFEKIIHLPFALPPLSTDLVKNYILRLTSELEDERVAALLASSLPRNPRKVKRVLQIFLFLRELVTAQIKGGKVEVLLLAKLVVIQHQFRTLFRQIVEVPSLLSALEEYALAPPNSDKQSVIGDPALRSRLHSLLEQFPAFSNLLHYGLGGNAEADAKFLFSKTRVEEYIYLLSTIAESTASISISNREYDPEAAQWQYLHRISSSFRTSNLQGIAATEEAQSAPLEQLYIRPKFAQGEGAIGESYALDDIFSESERTTIVGPAGSGKTTLLRYVALELAKSLQSMEPASVAPFGLREELLPIYVPVRNLHLRGVSPVAALLDFLNASYGDSHTAHSTAFFESALSRGKCFLLFDGLDEVPPEHRYMVAEIINSLADTFPGNRFLVSTRPGALESGLQLRRFQVWSLLPWTQEQVHAYLRQWDALAKTDTVSDAWRGILSSDTLSALSSNPLLLTLIAQVAHRFNELPPNRAQLYSYAMSMLLGRWDQSRGMSQPIKPERLEQFLSHIAYEMMIDGSTVFSREQARRAAGDATGMRAEDVDVLLENLVGRSGIVGQTSPQRFSFTHRTMQEYFAALHLSRHEILGEMIEERAGDPSWREVLAMAVSLHVENGDDFTQIAKICRNGKRAEIGEFLADVLLKGGVDSLTERARHNILTILDALELGTLSESARRQVHELRKILRNDPKKLKP